MNPDRWQKIGIIFEEALKLDEPERTEFLKSACDNDQEMIEEIITLIEADSNVPRLLKSKAADSINLLLHKNYEGKIIGKYRIIKQIAEGGMGAVFLAERADGQFNQKVALKIIKPGMNSAEIIKRFGIERQILASLQHPNIARLLDGGLTEENLPYFTMEYVEGKPIDEYCNGNGLSINERLKLFSKVCAAVQYAHQNLVIHRDLKPSNIMITKDGIVKLLDFGIAKVFTENDPLQQTAYPGTKFNVMTPEYASPEQVKGEHVTTSTDIYSLGLVLYLLLTGEKAFKLNSRSPVELEKIICLTEPSKPSSLISTKKKNSIPQTEGKDNIGNVQPDKLKKILSGDIDNICLTALRKEPGRRYASAEQFQQDIENFLKGMPVSARQSTPAYRAGKFIKRHKIAVISSFIIFTAVTVITTYYTIQLKRERDKARLEAQKAQQVAGFLKNIFKVSDPYQARGETITARELLDKGAQKINNDLSDQPDVKETMLNLIGEVYINLGLYEKAEKLFNEALRINEKDNKINADLAESLKDLGEIHLFKGEFKPAEPLLKKSMSIYSSLSQKNNIDYMNCLSDLAWYYYLSGNYDKADSLYINIIASLRSGFPDNNELRYTMMNDLALDYHEEGKYEKADSLFNMTLSEQKKIYGSKPHPELSTTTYNYAELLRDKGDYKRAEKMFRTSLDMDIKLHGPEHPDVAYSMQGLASIYRLQGKYGYAKDLYLKVLAMREKFLGKEHPDVAFAIYNIGLVYFNEQKYDSAKIYFTRSMTMHAKLNGPEHKSVGICLKELSDINCMEGNFNLAEQQVRHSMEIEKNAIGTQNLTYAGDLLILAFIKSAFKDKDSAYVLCRETEKTARASMGVYKSPFMAACLNGFAKIASEQKDYKKADSLYMLSISMHKQLMGGNNIASLLTYLSYCKLLVKTDSLNTADKIAGRYLKLTEKEFGAANMVTAKYKLLLGEIKMKQTEYPEAEKLLKDAYRFYFRGYGSNDMHTKEAVQLLASLYNTWGKKDESRAYHKLLN